MGLLTLVKESVVRRSFMWFLGLEFEQNISVLLTRHHVSRTVASAHYNP